MDSRFSGSGGLLVVFFLFSFFPTQTYSQIVAPSDEEELRASLEKMLKGGIQIETEQKPQKKRWLKKKHLVWLFLGLGAGVTVYFIYRFAKQCAQAEAEALARARALEGEVARAGVEAQEEIQSFREGCVLKDSEIEGLQEEVARKCEAIGVAVQTIQEMYDALLQYQDICRKQRASNLTLITNAKNHQQVTARVIQNLRGIVARWRSGSPPQQVEEDSFLMETGRTAWNGAKKVGSFVLKNAPAITEAGCKLATTVMDIKIKKQQLENLKDEFLFRTPPMPTRMPSVSNTRNEQTNVYNFPSLPKTS